MLVLLPEDERSAQATGKHGPETLAELAGAGAAAAAFADAVTDPALPVVAPPEQASEGAQMPTAPETIGQPATEGRRVVKRVRVVRRLVVNGQVVHEAAAEQVVDADADTTATVASLQQALGSADSETVAALTAGLPARNPAQQGGEPPTAPDWPDTPDSSHAAAGINDEATPAPQSPLPDA
jgi:hypothetical protein